MGTYQKGTYSFANLNNEERELKVEELTEKITHLASNIDNYNAHKSSLQKQLSKAYTVATMADESVLAMAMTEFNKTARNIRKEMSDCDSAIEQIKGEIDNLVNLKIFYSQPNLPSDIIEKAETDEAEKRKLVKELINKIVPYKITTFKKQHRDRGLVTLNFGVVLLEVYTVMVFTMYFIMLMIGEIFGKPIILVAFSLSFKIL